MRLYIYNGNLLQVSTFACLELSPAAWISAGGKFLSACGNGKSAGGHSLCQRMEEAVERQKEKACYNIRTMDTFHGSLVTSKPRLLQIMSYVTRNHISVLLIPPCRTKTEASFNRNPTALREQPALRQPR